MLGAGWEVQCLVLSCVFHWVCVARGVFSFTLVGRQASGNQVIVQVDHQSCCSSCNNPDKPGTDSLRGAAVHARGANGRRGFPCVRAQTRSATSMARTTYWLAPVLCGTYLDRPTKTPNSAFFAGCSHGSNVCPSAAATPGSWEAMDQPSRSEWQAMTKVTQVRGQRRSFLTLERTF